MTTRINARLDPRSAADLELIRRQTGVSSRTEALKYSLREVADRLRAETAAPDGVMQAFLSSDYIACASGPDISEDYKEVLTSGVRAKHDLD